jgi:glutamine amidotransferase
MIKVGIINYGMGNLGSVRRKFDLLGIHSEITSDYKLIRDFDKIIFPGVGHFAMGVENLKKLSLWDELNEAVLIRKKPILGICLGMQLMAKHSEEGDVDGLGWFDGTVNKFTIEDKLKYKIPHMGWNTLKICRQHNVLKGISEEDEFYFVHSYHFRMNTPDHILAETEYNYSFTSAVVREHIIGFQFHPEKSLETGKKLLRNFIKL